MEYRKTKLVEEGNTIYEIDLDCMRKKEIKRQQEEMAKRRPEKGNFTGRKGFK